MDAFIGEIRAYGFNYNPVNWMTCSGQLLPISQYTALFSILGTQYGGNGTTNFALPDLRSTVTNGTGQLTGGNTYVVGEKGGTSGVTLNVAQIPNHTHTVSGGVASSTSSAVNVPANNTYISNVFAKSSGEASGLEGHAYLPSQTTGVAQLNPQAIGVTGNSQPHDNMMPYVGINYCICVNGIFPVRS